MMKLRQSDSALLRIITIFVLAGPFVALLVLYFTLLIVTAWIGVSNWIEGASLKGAPMVGLTFASLLVLLFISAPFGVVLAFAQTFTTGGAVGILHNIRAAERATKYLPALPVGLVRFCFAFTIGFTISILMSPLLAPKSVQDLGPFSIQFAAAVSSGVCYLVALSLGATNAGSAKTPGDYANDA